MTVRRWESGEREPRASDIQKLCEVLGVTESELLNGLADDELKFTFVLDMKEVESMEVRMNEFKIGTGDNDIFGLFRIPKDTNVDEIGKQFMDHLRAELVGDKAKRDELKKLNG
jgi:transcriptional regulator with XRE-family HTH domain